MLVSRQGQWGTALKVLVVEPLEPARAEEVEAVLVREEALVPVAAAEAAAAVEVEVEVEVDAEEEVVVVAEEVVAGDEAVEIDMRYEKRSNGANGGNRPGRATNSRRELKVRKGFFRLLPVFYVWEYLFNSLSLYPVFFG